MGEITDCGLCGSPYLNDILDMGMQPLAERDSELYPLKLVQCGECSLVQLSYIVDQQEVFPRDHPYATGNTKFLRGHFSVMAAQLPEGSGPVVDIGANDGTFLSYVTGRPRVAVEPTNQIDKACARGIEHGYQEFFTHALAARIRAECGPADVVTACNVLAHVPDPHAFIRGVVMLLGPDGVFITENHDLASVTSGLQIDTVYHEHLRYYSTTSLSRLLSMHGLEVAAVEPVPTHGGSLRVTARRSRADFSSRANAVRVSLRDLVAQAAAGGPVYGIGAATRATPLIHFAGIAGLIGCVCEVSSSEKIGTCMPGTHIPVVDEARLIEDQPPYALLFSWHIADSLVPRLREMGYRGKLIIPLPEPRIIDG